MGLETRTRRKWARFREFAYGRGPRGKGKALLYQYVNGRPLFGLLLLAACALPPGPTLPPLETVGQLDLERYGGTWYEIAAYPTWFQKGCTESQATYTLRADGRLAVENRCRRGPGGEFDSVKGVAWVPDASQPAKLKVRFFWPFAADYWVIDLAPDYTYAVVGHPTRKYLWILSREPVMDERQYRSLLLRIEEQHYDTRRIVKTARPPHIDDDNRPQRKSSPER